jgi:hypothetical protein
MKTVIAFLGLFFAVSMLASAQDNIEVRSIEVNKDIHGVPNGSYKVSFRDNTVRYLYEDYPNNFTWYLSYKGKRVSDYYYSTATSMSTFSKTALTWPDAVPAGHEKYVTAQLGKEPAKKDRRD